MTARRSSGHKKFQLNTKTSITIIALLLVINTIVAMFFYQRMYVNNTFSGVVNINQQQTIGDVSVLITDVKIETSYVMDVRPKEGKEIISLNLMIENHSRYDFDIFPSINTFIRDNEGQTYQLTLAGIENPFSTNTVKPGEKVSGRLAYMVTSRNIPLYLYIENKNYSKPPFIIEIR